MPYCPFKSENKCSQCFEPCLRDEHAVRSASTYTAELFSIDLRKRIEKQFNVPVVLRVGKEPRYVHFASYDAETKTIFCNAERDLITPTIQDMLNGMAYNNALGAKKILVLVEQTESEIEEGSETASEGEHRQVLTLTGVSEKTTFHSKYTPFDAVIVEAA